MFLVWENDHVIWYMEIGRSSQAPSILTYGILEAPNEPRLTKMDPSGSIFSSAKVEKWDRAEVKDLTDYLTVKESTTENTVKIWPRLLGNFFHSRKRGPTRTVRGLGPKLGIKSIRSAHPTNSRPVSMENGLNSRFLSLTLIWVKY